MIVQGLLCLQKMKYQQQIFKASGKILVAGGYGVLQENNFGISLAVNRHFYAVVNNHSKQTDHNQVHISVQSPQIVSRWNYTFNKTNTNIAESNGLQNVFVQNAIKYSLKYALQKKCSIFNQISITVLFDRGFLSETQEQSQNKEKFITYKGNTSKTGLGSSACVLVSIVGAILNTLLTTVQENEINCVSQVANIAAQNKIGSNFDISTAVFGSHLYKNKLPKRAFQLIQSGSINKLLQIDPEIKKVVPNNQIKNNSCCFVIDLKKGSNTRVMVSSFIKTLHSLNKQVISQFYSQNKIFTQEIFKLFESQLNQTQLIDQLRVINCSYRTFLQKYSKQTNVPIEPPEFQQFLDQMTKIDGIAYAICPGSGGYDAIFVLGFVSAENQKTTLKKKISLLCDKYWSGGEVSEINIEWQKSQLSTQEHSQIQKFISKM